MRKSRSQAVTAPLRRWMLHSPSRLGIVVAVVVVLMIVVGHFMPGKQKGALSAAMAAEATPSTTATQVVVQAGAEVTPDQARAISDDDAKKSPQLMAMKYALAYTDINPTTGEWITALSKYTEPGVVNGEIVANRPTVPVAVSGQTSSTSKGKLVIVTTSAGDMTIRLNSTPGGWQVTTPLPTLDDTGSSPESSSVGDDSADDVPTSTSADASTSPSSPSVDTADVPTALLPSSAVPSAPAPTTPTTDPRPVPGPIPTPNLDGPLPGRR